MAENEIFLLTDKQIYPSDEIIFSVIGEKQIFWRELMHYMSGNYKESSGQWNYYNDGKRWLYKMVYKKKTIFWIGILEETFRVTFWFSDKAEPLIAESDLPEIVKEQFRLSKKYGSIRAVTVKINIEADIGNVKKLILIKSKIK
jgi:hypothetical protein